jgi:hypothetical protein
MQNGFYTGANSGLDTHEGVLKNVIDKNLALKKKPQVNKNVKPYKANERK